LPDQYFRTNIALVPGNQLYLERSHIDLLLEKAVQNPVVIVCAGAGYGKTHAVYAFVHKYNVLTSWIQLSERDNINERFWENFIAGVTIANKNAAVRLTEIIFPETERQFKRYLTIPETETDLGKKYIFVYDDFHLIHNKSVLRFMERSITSPFPNITSILICRTEPPINLIRLHAKGLLGRITEEDLRFSRDEMVEYFHIQHIKPSPQVISSIYHDTEGWAFAIHLAGLSLKNAPSGAEYIPQAMRSNIFKLIESEIMAVISADLRRFLIKLSLIDHLAPELLEEIAVAAGPKRQKTLIQEMEQIVSFIRFDSYLNAYQIHHLLLEYLSGKQEELSETEKQETYKKAAEWCVKNNQKMDAINYCEKAGDYDQLIAVIDTMPLVLPAHFARLILELLDRLLPKISEKNPRIYTVRLRTMLSLTMFEACERELKELIPRFEGLPPGSRLYRFLAFCYGLLGLTAIITSTYTGDYTFPVYIQKAAAYARKAGENSIKPPMSVINIGSYTCRVKKPEKGEMERFINAISQVVPYSPDLGGCGMGMVCLARAELAFFKGDMSGAENFALQAIRKAREGKQYEIENRSFFYLLRINLARGNFANIQDILKKLEAQLDTVHYFNRFTYHDIVTGWYYAQLGQTGKVAPWLKNDFEESDLNSMSHGLEILVKAKYLFAEKRYPAVLAALEGQEKKYDAGDFVMGMLEIHTLKALCHYYLRNREAAFATLEEAYKLAHPNALYMPFMELGKNMRALAGALIKHNTTGIPSVWLERVRRNASAYAKKVFMVTEQGRQPEEDREKTDRTRPVLSRREKEVLAGLSQGLTREEIAGHLSISVNTVKSVIRNVYSKFGAVNRADAVRIAASLGLL
jgi:LuxR family maltose regulon positive regulatory protein